MNKEEFSEYLDINSNVRKNFEAKALVYQQAKNQARQPARRWNDTKVDRAVDKMYAEVFDSIYEKIKSGVRSDDPKQWAFFIEENEIMDNLEESMNEIEFG